jgi:GT2 family glycosyltransferase
MLLFDDGRVQWAGQRLGLRSGYSGRPRGYGRPLADVAAAHGEPTPVPRAVGALMAVSRAAIEAVGTFDDDLFAYVEDVDWSLRIRAAGFGCWFVPRARAVHALSASTGGDAGSTATLYYGARNTVVACERHLPLGLVGTWLRRATIALTFTLRAATVQRSGAALRAVFDGVRDGVARRLGPRGGGG